MKKEPGIQELRKMCEGAEKFPSEVINWIAKENFWNLWVPKDYGGLEFSFGDGLEKLKSLARIDGSLGWTITLCSGANYFVGNLSPEVAQEIFMVPQNPILGGSGGVFGIAEKQEDKYKISGKWRYATGATYLTHFTLNARILEDGKELQHADGSARVLSFVIPKKDVHIIQDWNTMGLKATASHSFEIDNVLVHKKYSFKYNRFHLPNPIFKIDFSVFADLTLWVNYIGMAEHFLEEASSALSAEKLKALATAILSSNENITRYAQEIEEDVTRESSMEEENSQHIHAKAAESVQHLSRAIIEIYPLLGVKASTETSSLNKIFRDYFTATQHHIFTK